MNVTRCPAVIVTELSDVLEDEASCHQFTPALSCAVIVLPVGTVFEGRVTGTSPASAAARDGKLEVVIETIKFDHDIKRQIEGRPVSGFGRSSSSAPGVIAVVGGAAAGVLVGALTGSPAGAVLGAAVGAGAGTGVALARKGKEARIGKDEGFEIERKKEVGLPVVVYLENSKIWPLARNFRPE